MNKINKQHTTHHAGADASDYEHIGSLPDRSKKYRCCIVVPVYNRYYYVRVFLFFLRLSKLDNCLILFLDDASDDKKIIPLLSKFKHKTSDTIILARKQAAANPEPIRLLSSLHHNLDYVLHYVYTQLNSPYFCILDSDTIFLSDWLVRMLKQYQAMENDEPLIVSGFNTKAHEEIKSGEGIYYKNIVGGISMLFNHITYTKIFTELQPNWDIRISEKMVKLGYPIVCIRPSVIQHIGITQGSFSHLLHTDIAYDFFPIWFWTLAEKIRSRMAKWRNRQVERKMNKSR